MKKLIAIFVTLILVLVAVPMSVFANEGGKSLNTQLTRLELQNDNGETIKEISVGSSFRLFADYSINDTVHTGDYFDMTVPSEVDLSSAFTNYNFTLNDSQGEVIANATIKPSDNGGGTVHVVFNEKANNKSNLKGNLFFYARGNAKGVKLGEVTPIKITINNSNANSYSVAPPVKFTPNKPVSGTEVIGKWANPSKSKDRADWRIRINKSGQDLKNVVITDKIKSGNGEYLPEFKLQKVTFAEAGNITSYGEEVDVTNKIKYNSDKTSFTLDLGSIGTQGYLLSYATTVNDEDPVQNNSAELTANAIDPSKSSGVWLYKAAGGGLSTEISGKLRIRKVDSETGKGLAGAKFKVTKGDKSFELTSNDKGIALSDKLELGEYNVTEVTAPSGYKATDEVFTVNVTKDGGVLTIKNTKEKPETPTKPEEPNKPDTPNKPEKPNVDVPNKPEEPSKPEKPEEPSKPEKPNKPETPNVDVPNKPEEPKKPDTPSIEVPKENKVEQPKENNQESPRVEQKTIAKKFKDIPKTGDDMNIILYSFVSGFSAGVVIYLLKRKRNR